LIEIEYGGHTRKREADNADNPASYVALGEQQYSHAVHSSAWDCCDRSPSHHPSEQAWPTRRSSP
jgi:hypothetical protein